MGAVGMVLLGLIKTLITVWELVTNWAYSLLTNPSQKLQDYNRVLSAPQEEIKENDTEVVMNKFCAPILHIANFCQVTYIPKAGHKTQLISEFESSNIQTMADVWKWSVKK